jgi:hypothetical protein
MTLYIDGRAEPQYRCDRDDHWGVADTKVDYCAETPC